METKQQNGGDAPRAVFSTEKERQARAYSPLNLRRALDALHQDGLVVLKDVIDTEHIDSLNKAMTDAAEAIKNDPTKTYNHNVKCCRSLFIVFNCLATKIGD